MQSPKFNTNVFGDRSVNTSGDHENLLRIGPWPIKRSGSEGEAFTHVREVKDTCLSFSETMAQIDEVYAITTEMENPDKREMHSQHYKKPTCDWLLALVIILAIMMAGTPPLVAYLMVNHQYGGNLLFQPGFIDARWRIFCRTLLYIVTAATGAVLWITLILVRHIQSPFAVPLSTRNLALSGCAGNLLAIWTLKWI